jgi:predicted ABC-type ATPase
MRGTRHPSVVVLAGPNGSGKSTTAPALLRGALGVTEFVNADTIAQGLSAYNPLSAALEAGRIMLDRMRSLAAARVDFAFETTLASRSLAPWLAGLVRGGYDVHLLLLWLPSADEAVARVAQRFRSGGHDVPEEMIRRRYTAGLRNFFRLYRPLATKWRMYDRSMSPPARLIAVGRRQRTSIVLDELLWRRIQRSVPE